MRPRYAVAAVLALALLGAGAGAARAGSTDGDTAGDLPLSAEVSVPLTRPRSTGPLPLEVRFDNRTPGLVEGVLEVEFLDGNRVLSRYRSGELALTSGVQTFRFLVALPRPVVYAVWMEGRAWFRTAGRRYRMGGFRVPAAPPRGRSLSVCVAAAPGRGAAAVDDMVRSLFLEAYDPSPQSRARLTTFPAVTGPREMPVNPLGYCSHDLVVLRGGSFTALQRRQLEALLAWVRGGGSLLVLPEGVLQPHHLHFLNELAGPERAPFVAGPDGRLATAAPLRSRCGLGRAVVLTAPPDSLHSRRWRRTVAFLWKLRADQRDRLVAEGAWSREAEQSREGIPDHRRPSEDGLAFSREPLGAAGDFHRLLLPPSVRLVPIQWILLLLLGFVLAVGPADYFLLGRLRLRKLTWITFPLLAVAFTAATMLMARHYLGANSARGRLTFVDLGRGGRALRVSEYEMVFAASERRLNQAAQNALTVPMEPDRFGRWRYRRRGGSPPGPPVYRGRIPTQYTLRRRVRQWDPALRRTLWFEREAPDFGLHWDALSPSVLHGMDRSTKENRLLGDVDFDGVVLVVNGPGHYWLKGNLSALRGMNLPDTARITRTHRSAGSLERLLQHTAARPRRGMFSLVSQLSPAGAGDFEDLALTDELSEDQWVVMAVRREGNDLIVCRRAYYHGE